MYTRLSFYQVMYTVSTRLPLLCIPFYHVTVLCIPLYPCTLLCIPVYLFTLACILRQCFSGVVPSNTRACSILLVCIANVWSCQASPPDISDKRKFPFGPGAIDAEVASCPSMEGTPLGEFCQGTNLCYDQRRMGL